MPATITPITPTSTSINSNSQILTYEQAIIMASSYNWEVTEHHEPPKLEITCDYPNFGPNTMVPNPIPTDQLNIMRTLIRTSPIPINIIIHSDLMASNSQSSFVYCLLFISLGFKDPFIDSDNTVCRLLIHYDNDIISCTTITKNASEMLHYYNEVVNMNNIEVIAFGEGSV